MEEAPLAGPLPGRLVVVGFLMAFDSFILLSSLWAPFVVISAISAVVSENRRWIHGPLLCYGAKTH